MKLSCDIIRDLIPLVKDGVASEDSTDIVREHILSCQCCKEEFDTFESIKFEEATIKDAKVISAIKRSIFIWRLTILLIGAAVGAALSNSMGMFYNFLIMPVIGGIGLITFKKKWYWTPVAAFVITYLWQTIKSIIMGGFELAAVYSGLYYSCIYTFLVLTGTLITALLQFELRKER
ncbi:MAG: zf-HC2 domain-containing protein [Clostridiaceae bacterium]